MAAPISSSRVTAICWYSIHSEAFRLSRRSASLEADPAWRHNAFHSNFVLVLFNDVRFLPLIKSVSRYRGETRVGLWPAIYGEPGRRPGGSVGTGLHPESGSSGISRTRDGGGLADRGREFPRVHRYGRQGP